MKVRHNLAENKISAHILIYSCTTPIGTPTQCDMYILFFLLLLEKWRKTHLFPNTLK